MKQIILYGKHGDGKSALVDDEDYNSLNHYRWHVKKHRNTFYAVRSVPLEGRTSTKLKMHRVILGLTDPNILCDHIDHNGLNCQRYNLRPCDNASNRKNTLSRKNSTSKYLGVFIAKSKTYKAYAAQIGIDGKSTYLGTFKFTPEGEILAAKAYDEAAKKHFGEFANLNFK